MSNYGGNGGGRRRGYYPRKGNLELDNFLPDSIKNASVYVRPVKPTAAEGSQPQRANNGGGGGGGGRGGSRPRNGGKKVWAEDLLYDDRSSGKFKYSQPKEYITNDRTANNKILQTPLSKIGSETFQTPIATNRTTSPVNVASRRRDEQQQNVGDKRREPAELLSNRMRILKPNNGVTTNARNSVTADKPSVVPVILARAKVTTEGSSYTTRDSSPKIVIASNQKGPVTVATPYRIASKPTVLAGVDKRVVVDKLMNRPFRFIDDDFGLCEGYTAVNAYLLDQPDFMVVGVIGRQGVGKSAVASLLANSANLPKKKMAKFSQSSASSIQSCMHSTQGIDMLVTMQRMIVLDFPASLSTGAMDANNGRGDGSAIYQDTPLEMQINGKAMQFLSLAIKICDVIVVVQDDPCYGTEILKCLQVASMMSKARLLDATEAYNRGARIDPNAAIKVEPSVIVVHTKKSVYTPSERTVSMMQTQIHRLLAYSPLIYYSELTKTKVNMLSLTVPTTNGQYEPDEARALFSTVTNVIRKTFPLLAPLTERTWFEYTVREWEKIRKSLLYLDYSRLYP